MVDWTSPDEILHDSRAHYANVVVFAGVFVWEYCLTFPLLEWPLLSGRMRFKWPMFLPLVARLFLLAGISCDITLLKATTKTNCNAIYKVLIFTYVICTTTSSGIFMLRAMALWSGNRIVTITLVVLQLGQLALWCRLFATNDDWTGSGCSVVHLDQGIYVAATSVPPGRAKGLGQILFRDGLAYIGSVMLFHLANIYAS